MGFTGNAVDEVTLREQIGSKNWELVGEMLLVIGTRSVNAKFRKLQPEDRNDIVNDGLVRALKRLKSNQFKLSHNMSIISYVIKIFESAGNDFIDDYTRQRDRVDNLTLELAARENGKPDGQRFELPEHLSQPQPDLEIVRKKRTKQTARGAVTVNNSAHLNAERGSLTGKTRGTKTAKTQKNRDFVRQKRTKMEPSAGGGANSKTTSRLGRGVWQELADVLLPRTRQLILATVLSARGRKWGLRELAAELGLPASSVQKELGILAGVGIFRRAGTSSRPLYAADEKCAIIKELRGIISKTVGFPGKPGGTNGKRADGRSGGKRGKSVAD